MPWREVSVMEQRREFVRLAMQEGANRRELCRRFGIHPETGYKWLARWQAGQDVADRSRRPHGSPRRTASVIEQRVVAVRDAHPAWGARKIARCLEREEMSPPAVSTVHQILRRSDRIKAPLGGAVASQRFEMPAPNLLWQMDFKGWVRLGNDAQCHPLTVVDDHSRYDLCLQACADQRGDTVRDRLQATFRHYGLPEAFFVDNGSPWGDPSGEHWTRFEVWLLKLGIAVIHSRPYHPQGRGKNERFHRTLNAEVLALRCFRDLAETSGAKSTISSDHMKRSTSRCRPAAISRANGQCPNGCRSRNTTAPRSSAPYRRPKPTSASRAGSGRCRKPSAANVSPSGLRQTTASTAFSSPPTGSPAST
jgi:transposase InsO family protein